MKAIEYPRCQTGRGIQERGLERSRHGHVDGRIRAVLQKLRLAALDELLLVVTQVGQIFVHRVPSDVGEMYGRHVLGVLDGKHLGYRTSPIAARDQKALVAELASHEFDQQSCGVPVQRYSCGARCWTREAEAGK